MEYPLVIQYSTPVGPDLASLFFRIEQELDPDDPPSVDEVAQAIDAVTGQDFCNRTVAKNGYQPPENKSPAEQQASFRDFFSEKLSDPLIAQDFAQRLGIEQPCKAALGEPITIPLKIFWQTLEIAENYRLESTSDVEFSKSVLVRENLEKEFKISEASEKNIEYYIDIDEKIPLWKQVEFEWIGGVVDENKNIASGPTEISINNNAIVKWGERVSGTFVIKFKTLYHAVQAKITPENGDYSTTVYGVWDGPAVFLDLVVPEKKEREEDCPIKDLLSGNGSFADTTIKDDDPKEETPEITCFWLTTHELRQPCGDNELIESWETFDQVKCPDDAADRTPTVNSPMSLGYIEEIESRYYYELGKRTIPEYISTSDSRFSHNCEACTEAGFEEACCRAAEPGEPIPPCLEIKSTFYGGVEIEKGRDHWKKKYPAGVTFQEKLPEDGYCGENTLTFEIKNCDPCKDVPELVWDEGNPQIIAPNSSVDLELTGGNHPDLPITWEITVGGGYSFSSDKEVQSTIAGLLVTLYAGPEPCGDAEIIASDDCSQAAGSVVPTNNIAFSLPPASISRGAYEYFPMENITGLRTCTLSGADLSEVWFTGYQGTNPLIARTNYSLPVSVSPDLCGDRSMTLTVSDDCGTVSHSFSAIGSSDPSFVDPPASISRGAYEYFPMENITGLRTCTLSGADSSEVWFTGYQGTNPLIASTNYSLPVSVGDGAEAGTSFTLTVSDDCGTVQTTVLIV